MTPELRAELTAMRDRLNQILAATPQLDLLGKPITDDKPPPRKRARAKTTRPIPRGLIVIRTAFGHKETTIPPENEMDAYESLRKRITDAMEMRDQILKFLDFYKLRGKQSHGDPTLWPTGALRALNIWDEVQARADLKLRKSGKITTEDDRPAPKEPKNWRQWAIENWGNRDGVDFGTITWQKLGEYEKAGSLGLRLEIHRNCK